MTPLNSKKASCMKDLDLEIERIHQKMKESDEEKERIWNEKSTSTELQKPQTAFDDRNSKYIPNTSKHNWDLSEKNRNANLEKLEFDRYRNCRYTTPVSG
jgi:hypothetical protein